jgi:pimeloyl-ACP methyl ester carboxylesterase
MSPAHRQIGPVARWDGDLGFPRTGVGPVLVLVEPVGHFRQFSAFDGLAALLGAQSSVITYDRRGSGASDATAPIRSGPYGWVTLFVATVPDEEREVLFDFVEES